MAIDYNSFKDTVKCSEMSFNLVKNNSYVNVTTLDGLGKKSNINAELLIKVYQCLQETVFEFYELLQNFAISFL